MYPIIHSLMEMPRLIEEECPLCHGSRYIPYTSPMVTCRCQHEVSLRRFQHIPHLKLPTKLSKVLEQRGPWLIHTSENMSRLCYYDIHLRRALLDMYQDGLKFTWKDLTTNELINICWYQKDRKDELIIKPDILSIKMLSWSLADEVYNTVCEVLTDRSEKNLTTLIASPNITKDTKFVNKQFSEWYAKMIEGKHVKSLIWPEQPDWFDDQFQVAPIPAPQPLKVFVREEQVSKEEKIAAGMAAFREPLPPQPSWMSNIPTDEEED